jgi:isopenicillin N synthase-like dioxygenase
MWHRTATVGIAAATSAALFILYQFMSQKKKKNEEKKEEERVQFQIQIVDLTTYLDTKSDDEGCRKIADALHRYGVVVIRDPRVPAKDNDRYLDMMETYFALSDGVRDARPEYSYQVGVTPSHTERPRNHCSRMGSLGPNDQPLSPCPPELDPKWRFFWRIGPLPPFPTQFPALNMDPVIPPEIPRWREVMDTWGSKLLECVQTTAEMAAIGFDMPADSFTKRMLFGPHLLAPTGSDYATYDKEGTVLAGYHYDLNFLTIHGKSRYPGLYIWTRNGRREAVVVPHGCLLVQAGKQLEHLTGGHVLAGFHEVVISEETCRVIEQRKREGQSLWRVSSTLFAHVQSDQVLQPLPPFDKSPTTNASFLPMLAGDQVTAELRAISLHKAENKAQR